MTDTRRCKFLRKLYDVQINSKEIRKAIEGLPSQEQILGQPPNWRAKMLGKLQELHPKVSTDRYLTSYGDGRSLVKLFAALRHSIVHLNSTVYPVLRESKRFWKHEYADDEYLWLHYIEDTFPPFTFELWLTTQLHLDFAEYRTEAPRAH